MKLSLEDLCGEWPGLKNNMEMDDGNSFSYNVTVKFPVFFKDQMIRTQFAPYDAVPEQINPQNVGRDDFETLRQEKIKKQWEDRQNMASKSPIDDTMIQRMSQRYNIQFINHVEKALFGEFNNGQLPDFPKTRLMKCHWLPYVCFKPEIGRQ